MKQTLYLSLFLGLFLLMSSCGNELPQRGFQPDKAEYWPLLVESDKDPLAENASMLRFWSDRLDNDSTGVGELGPLGAAYEARFQLEGNYQDLDRALTLYKLGIRYSAHHKDQFVRHAARVAISQHDFQTAYASLDSLLISGGQNRQTRLQLFDAAMEVAQYATADSLLMVLEDPGDFNYLIRAAKWNDHRGDLETAIRYMEQAKQLAEAKDSPPLLQWVNSNLATFYGHAGRLEESYRLNLEVLKLNPRHVQSLKQMAWLEYASALNPEAALEILDHTEQVYKGLDLLLLKADILEFQGNLVEAGELRKTFIDKVERQGLTQLFANDLILLWSERTAQAQALARSQYDQRPTQIQAALLASTLQLGGAGQEALQLIQSDQLEKANEPLARYLALKTLHSMGSKLDQEALTELGEARFELGPIKAAEVANW